MGDVPTLENYTYENTTPEHMEQSNTLLTFLDSEVPKVVTAGMARDPTSTKTSYRDADLAEFFARPVRIGSFLWNLGA